MVVQTQIRLVQGFFVESFTVKSDTIKVTLKGNKDDLRAGDGDVGDILKSLELHATAGEDATLSAALLRDGEDTPTTYPCPFVVVSFTVKQDDIKLVVEADKENLSEEDGATDVVKSLAIHSAGGSDRPVELTLARADIE